MKIAFNLCFILLLSSSAICHEKLMESSFRIRAVHDSTTQVFVSFGTAFGVDLSDWGLKGKHYLLTANHGLCRFEGREPEINIELKEGEWEKCQIVSTCPELDLAIISTEKEIPTLRLSDKDAIPEEEVFIAGASKGQKVTESKGVVKKRFEAGSLLTRMQIHLEFGDSGSAVFSPKSGKVVGIVIGGFKKGEDLDHDQALFIPICVISSFLDEVKKQFP